MAIVKSKGGMIDIFVPGVKEKKSKGESKVVRSDAVDDLWELAEHAKSGEYAGVILDTWTKMSTAVLRNVASTDTSSQGKGTNRVNLSTKGGKKIDHPTMQDYGMLASILEQWRYEVWPANQGGTVIALSGHEKLVSSETEEGYVVEAFGALGCEGKLVTKNLPGYLITLLRGVRQRKQGSRRPPRMIVSENIDPVWKAKDRLGVWDPDGVECEWPRKKGEGIEEHKQRIAEGFAELWDPWVEEWFRREIGGFLGMYADPGWGKTLCLGGLAWSLSEVTSKPCLFADWDTEGSAALPVGLIEEEEE